ncbi:metallophosphoesterase [Shewanella sp.]|uniref:metallophosphoesterase family protein n=1 Tax=Shewanella sp. TaxID=50422 RepID=UPI001EC07E0F|nr:metallophosphoesterase [Shewanella sp.]NRB23216.1 metallophosphoesterase [Shewanella sp.]
MNPYKLSTVSLLIIAAISGCNSSSNDDNVTPEPEANIRIAFMPDIHFHDVYGEFSDGAFSGLPNSHNDRGAIIRTMQSQMESTRLFNENYFAMIAALDDVVAKGIKYVALPGDFSDDGQPLHMRGLVKIFDRYSEEYGLEFFAAPGNHDPNRPFTQAAGKSDYLGVEGKQQRIFSKGKNECVDYEGDTAIIDAGHELPTICSEEVIEWGYKEIMTILGPHGFEPHKQHFYFETPYSSDDARTHYTYEKAASEAQYENRQFEICYEGTGGRYKQADYTQCSVVPDSSYVVEPVEGLWLLAIDANVYRPDKLIKDKYDGSSSAGYNMMLTHKQQVIDWISDVVKSAKMQGKTLISFSHFPMTDFYNGASEEIEDIFGEGNFQLAREPEDDTSKALAATGLSVHVGGHMHFNDTGMKRYNIDGEQYTLFNIQAPSLAGYIPAYKVLNVLPHSQIEVETVILEEVPRFNELFEHYALEHEHLTDKGYEGIWNKAILDSDSYYQLTEWHLTELTRLRFLPKEWPEDIKTMLFNMDGKQMMTLSQIETDITVCQLKAALELDLAGCPAAKSDTVLLQFLTDWKSAKDKAEALAIDHGLELRDFAQWNGTELALDFYRLRNADELAFRDIDATRLPQYKLLSEELSQFDQEITSLALNQTEDASVGDLFKSRFGTLFYILERFATGEASDHFLIDTENGSLTDLKTVTNRAALL